MRGLSTNEELVQSYLTTLNAKLDVYEQILSKQMYIGGDVSLFRFHMLTSAHTQVLSQAITLVDLFHIPYGSVLAKINIDVLEDSSKRPHVVRSV